MCIMEGKRDNGMSIHLPQRIAGHESMSLTHHQPVHDLHHYHDLPSHQPSLEHNKVSTTRTI